MIINIVSHFKCPRVIVAILFTLLVFLGPIFGEGEKVDIKLPETFTASQKIKLSDGLAFRRTLTKQNDLLRIESSLDKTSYMIIDLKKKTVTTVLGMKKQYFTLPYEGYSNYDLMMDDTFLYLQANSGTIVGKELFQDKEYEKLSLSINGSELYLLCDAKSKLPKRLESSNGATHIEWLDWKASTEKNNDPAYFKVPSDFTIIDVFAPKTSK